MATAEVDATPDGSAARATAEPALCFTDIVGSTRLLAALGDDDYTLVLERHRAIIRAAVAATGGIEVMTEGDGFFLVFREPAAALAFAVAAQRGLTAEPWPPNGTIRVRIGLHHGRARQQPGGDYVGLAVHQAARVGAIGHGGQVVVTEHLDRVAQPPEGYRLVRLGAHRLRDFGQGVDLLQLAGPGLPERFPPLAAPREARGLPVPRTPLVGRERELERLVETAAVTPFVSLVGPGGVGKTRLAVEAALALNASFPDGVHLIELSTVAPADVSATVAAAVGARPEQGQSAIEALTTRLGAGRRLLLLDSCERALDEVASLIDAVLRTCHRTSVLVTTTEAVQLADERVVPVGPLASPVDDSAAATALQTPAVRLLLDRAEARGAAIDDPLAVADLLGTLARRLDGIPLALELAAGRMAELGLQAVVDGLDDRFSLLTNGYRTSLPHHRTLEAMVAWTVDLLSPAERDLLGRLSALAGQWPMDEVAVVAGGEGGASALRRLVDRSLVVQQDGQPPRARLLDTVRAYATRLVPAEVVDDVRARSLDLMRARLAALPGARMGLVTEIDLLLPDIREALSWGVRAAPSAAADLAFLCVTWFEFRGAWQEGVDRLTPLAAACGTGPDHTRLLSALALLHSLQGHHSEAQAAARQVLDDPNATDLARATALLAATPPGAPFEGEADPVAEALRLAESPVSSVGLAARTRLALRKVSEGDPYGAAADLATIADDARENDSPVHVAQATVNRGTVLIMTGDIDQAEEVLRFGQELCLDLGLRSLVAPALGNLSNILLRRGRPAEALAAAEERLAIAEGMGDLRGSASALTTIGVAAGALGHTQRSLEVASRACELYRSLGQADGIATSLFNLAMLQTRRGDFLAAAAVAADALVTAAGGGGGIVQALGLLAAGGVLSAAGDSDGLRLVGAGYGRLPTGLPLDPDDHAWLDASVAVVGERVGQDACAELRVSGADMSIPDAIALGGAAVVRLRESLES